MARVLLSSDPATWHEAQLRLASAGPCALDALDRPALLDSPLGRARAREVLRGALVLSVPVSELHRHPRLEASIADDLRWSRILAQAVSRRRWIATPDSVEVPPPADRSDQHRRLNPLDELIDLRGLAMPAVMAMLHDDRPVARVYACVALYHMGAVVAADSLAILFHDDRSVTIDGGDYFPSTTVARTARENTATLTSARGSRFRFEAPLGLLTYQGYAEGADASSLINAIRGRSNALNATSWDAWWDEARPVWDVWWHTGDGRGPPSADEFWNALSEYDGYHEHRLYDHTGARSVDVDGPSGTTCRVLRDSVAIAVGPAPFHWQLDADSSNAEADADRRIELEVRRPDGWVMRTGLLESWRWRIEILAQAKERRPAPRIEPRR